MNLAKSGLPVAFLLGAAALGLPAAAQSGAASKPATVDSGWKPSTRVPGAAARDSIGHASEAGPFLYWYRATAGIALGPHRHTADMRIRVLSGRKFILMGNPPEAAQVKQFEAGQTFVIPAGTWHVEWWESDTVEEITGTGPMRTERPPAVIPARP
jgi:hypothetical protein